MNSKLTDRALEERYVGGAMLDPSVLRDHPLPLAAFSVEPLRRVVEALRSLDVREERVSADSLDAELGALGYETVRATKPFDRLAQSFLDDPASVASRLRELMTRRALVVGAHEAASMLERGDSMIAVQGLLRRLADTPDAMDEDRTALESAKTAAESAMLEAQAAAEGSARNVVTTGLPALDRAFFGWDRGDLVVLAGDTNSGKSTSMIAMGRAQALAGERVLIVSLEDSRVRWGRRLVSSAANIQIRSLKRGELSSNEWSRLGGAVSALANENIWLAYPLAGSIDEVLHAIRRARQQHRVTVAWVDYLQAMALTNHSGGEELALRHHIRDALSALRHETARGDVPLTIGVGSQYKKREDTTKRPRNGDLYEAAYIEQKADAIMHIWRDGEGARRWALGKHKDEDPIEGLLLREEATGLLANSEASAVYTPKATKSEGRKPSQRSLDERAYSAGFTRPGNAEEYQDR